MLRVHGVARSPLFMDTKRQALWPAIGDGVPDLAIGDHVIVTLIRSCGRCYFCVQGDPHLCEGYFARDDRAKLHNERGDEVVALP